jgi:hypothetical protein
MATNQPQNIPTHLQFRNDNSSTEPKRLVTKMSLQRARMERRTRIAQCIDLMENIFPTEGLKGEQEVGPEGILVAHNKKNNIALEAHHEGDVIVDFDHPLLIRFLEGLARGGCGKMGKFDDVEYEFIYMG